MKFFLLLALFLGIALALETATTLEPRQKRSRKRTTRPKKSDAAGVLRAPNKPRNAPADFKTGTGKTSVTRSKAALKRLPPQYIDPENKRRRDSFEVLKKLRGRQVNANDFFECYSVNPRPTPGDCDIIIDSVLSSSDELIVTRNSCLIFAFRTCQAFFCSLCQTLSTTTDFIGNQLDTVDALCIENGQTGTIVGEDAPQWDAGFTYANAPLPSYDVC